jgi:2-polyprenyl-3-methyl-5-hydroxy-6-metoxy-1,4-benzoquinol methylase
MNPLSDEKILASWHGNATPWTTAVRERQIASRRLVTDRAIIEAVLSFAPASVLDIGCGEGWLTRALARKGIVVTGVDAVAELIGQARQIDSDEAGADYQVMSYEQIASGAWQQAADVAVCNFSLLGKESVDGLFAAMHSLLHPAGHLLVQTPHPRVACGDGAYEDGWREGSWAGFSPDFRDPAPWYFRTMESWIRLFAQHGLRLIEQREPLHPLTGQPASVIFIAENPA